MYVYKRDNMWIVFYVILQVSLGRTEREYFLQPNASSWEAALQHCRVCYKELATITADNALHLLEKLDNSNLAVWVGLRRMLNKTIVSLSNTTSNTESTQHLESRWFSGTPPWVQLSNSTVDTFDSNSTWFSFFEGKLPWSHWSNGDPVTFQNWYPGRPVPKPKPEPIKCDPNTGTNMSPTTPQSHSSTDSNFTVDGNFTRGMPRQTATTGTTEQMNENSTCPRLEKLLQCIDDPEAKDALSRSLTTTSLYQTSSSTTISPNTATINTTVSSPNNTVSASPVTISTSTSAPGTISTSTSAPGTISTSTSAPSTILTTDTPPSINTTNTAPTLNMTNLNFTFSQNDIMFGLNTVSASTVTISTSTSAPSTISTTATPCPTITDSREEDLNKFIEDACLVLLSFGMWWERACSEVLPYICYDDRFYGELKVLNITNNSASLDWLEAPGEISGYRVEVESEAHNWIHTPLTTKLSTELKNLNSGSKYTVYVYPIKCGRDLNPQTRYFYSQPDQIHNLTISAIQETSVTLSWNPPSGGVDFYRLCVYYIISRNCVNVNTSEYTVQNLVAGGEYIAEVRTEVADMSICSGGINQTFYTKPNIVKDLHKTNYSTTYLKVAWSPPDGHATSYHVLVEDISATHDVENISVTVNSTNYTATDLEPGSKFNITVWARVNNSLNGDPVTITGYTQPLNIMNLILHPVSPETHSIGAKWSNPNKHSLNFSLTLSNPNIGDMSNNTSDSNFTYNGLRAGAQYTVKVKVIGFGGLHSSTEETSTFTWPNPPKNLTVICQNKSTIFLNWDVPENSDDVTIQYVISYNTTFWGDLNKTQVTTTNVTLHNLRPGTEYNFGVLVSAGNQTSKSINASGKTEPNKRNITLMMLCTSKIPFGCHMNNVTDDFLTRLRGLFSGLNGVFWELNWKNNNEIQQTTAI